MVLAALAMPPLHLLLPAFIYLAPAAVLLARGQADSRPGQRHLRQGFRFGFATNLVTLWWLPVALWRLDPGMTWVAALILLCLSLATGLLFLVAGYLARRLAVSLLWIFPTLWLSLEWVLAHLGPFAFPRLGPAAMLSDFPVFLQLADIAGSRGLDWLLVVVNAGVGLAWLDRRSATGRRLGWALAGMMTALWSYGLVRMRTLPQRVTGTAGVLQPNTGFLSKWDRVSQDSAVAGMIVNSRELIARDHPDVVIWPETAVPDFFQQRPDWRDWIRRLAAETGTPVVIGGLDLGADPGDDRHYNAAFLVGASGTGATPVYHKRHLVPWVEWVPRGRSRSLPFGAYSAGDTGVVFLVGRIRASVIICFEAAFAGAVRDDRRRGADLVLNLSNDAWVSGTPAPWQGPAHLVLRAIENRVGIVRAANTGPSQFIRPDGVVERFTAYGSSAMLAGPVWISPVHTLFTRTGDWVGPLAALCSVLMLVTAGVRSPAIETRPSHAKSQPVSIVARLR